MVEPIEDEGEEQQPDPNQLQLYDENGNPQQFFDQDGNEIPFEEVQKMLMEQQMQENEQYGQEEGMQEGDQQQYDYGQEQE